MNKALASLGLAALLTACGSAEDELDAPVEAEIPANIPDAPRQAVDDTPDSAGDTGAEPIAQTDVSDGTIAARYHGKWDAMSSDCKTYTDGRVQITGTEIRFIESYGEVTKVTADGKDVVVDVMLFEPGDTPPSAAKERLSLSMTPNGVQLHVTDGSKPKEASDTPLKRCQK